MTLPPPPIFSLDCYFYTIDHKMMVSVARLQQSELAEVIQGKTFPGS